MFKLLTRDILCAGKFAVMSTMIAVSISSQSGLTHEAEIEIADDSVSVPRDIAAMEQIWLAEHNAERARLGLKPLIWDIKFYEHADQSNAADAQGENMWMGTLGAYDAQDMVRGWITESVDFQPGTFPNVSKTGNWIDIGHYTQLIWPDTTNVGCALVGNPRDEYMVCRYLPAGNVLGEKIGVK
jgi:Cysteine-rich secretory protein family